MIPTLLAIRSIGAEFANRVFFIVAIVATVMLVVLLTISVLLTNYSSLWWLLTFLIIMLMSIVIGVLVVVKLVIRSVKPKQTSIQRKQVKALVSKLERVSVIAGTPKTILLLQIVRDIAAPRENGFIGGLTGDSVTLQRDFAELTRTFKNQ